ncbi:hypothetical protein ACFQ3S_05345 [Mucilaginibacter terrae]|uniref:hypothetical protein n=1 Tax=Mucilaginibacter terrae TaxID=1955052 RepID=UPI0036447471
MDTEPLKLFVAYAISMSYKAAMVENYVMLYDVVNPGNDFRVQKTDDYYSVLTTHISKSDMEYSAKCKVYLLLAGYNKKSSSTSPKHINFKVDL